MRFQSFFMLITDQLFFFACGHQRVGERADFGLRSISVLALIVVVMHEHHQPRAVARLRVLEHLFVVDRVTERGDRAAADHHVNAFRLAGAIVVQQKLGHFG